MAYRNESHQKKRINTKEFNWYTAKVKTEYRISEVLCVGFVVMRFCEDGEGWFSSSSILNFGSHEQDAKAFRDDCTKGVVSFARIENFINQYTDTPYRYVGNGKIRMYGYN